MHKKIFATLVAFALVAISASAQEVKVDNSKFSTPTEYIELGNYKFYNASADKVVEWFNKNEQSDSLFVLNKLVESKESIKYFVTKYYWLDGVKQMDNGDPFVWERPKVVDNGDKISFGRFVYKKTTTSQMTTAEKEDVLDKKKKAFDPEHKNLLGWDRHMSGVAVLGGGNLVESKFNPLVTGRWFYGTCHFAYELEGTYSTASHTEKSAGYGTKYSTFIGSANFVWKAFHLNPVKTTYIGVGLNAGYGFHKTDLQGEEFYSQNFGFTGGGFIRFSGSMSRKILLIVEGGYKFYPKVPHGKGQDFSCNGPYMQVGFAWTIRNK